MASLLFLALCLGFLALALRFGLACGFGLAFLFLGTATPFLTRAADRNLLLLAAFGPAPCRLALLLDKGSFVEDGLLANSLADDLPADGVVALRVRGMRFIRSLLMVFSEEGLSPLAAAFVQDVSRALVHPAEDQTSSIS